MAIAPWIVGVGSLYLAAGAIFAVPFVLIGAMRIDPAAAHGTAGFRWILLPGAIALWPILGLSWLRAGAGAQRQS